MEQNTKLEPYGCKRFNSGKKGQGKWEFLGTVHAQDSKEAWDKAIKQWGKVDSVYYLYAMD